MPKTHEQNLADLNFRTERRVPSQNMDEYGRMLYVWQFVQIYVFSNLLTLNRKSPTGGLKNGIRDCYKWNKAKCDFYIHVMCFRKMDLNRLPCKWYPTKRSVGCLIEQCSIAHATYPSTIRSYCAENIIIIQTYCRDYWYTTGNNNYQTNKYHIAHSLIVRNFDGIWTKKKLFYRTIFFVWDLYW